MNTWVDLIDENSYAEQMYDTVVPALDRVRESGTFERLPGEKIYYEHYPATEDADSSSAGAGTAPTVVLVHGFSETIAKYTETIYYFLASGFDVWAIEQRGHGRSFRGRAGSPAAKDPFLVDIYDYRELIDDLHYFVHEVVMKDRPGENTRMNLFGHSMGGGVCACYLERYPEDFEKAVLCSPMLEMSAGGTPVWAASAYANMLVVTGKGSLYMPGSEPFSGKPDFEGSCANSPDRYAWYFQEQKSHPEYQMGCSSVRTALQFLRMTKEAMKPENISRIRAKVLLLQAQKDTMVGLTGQKVFIGHMHENGQDGRLVRFPGSKHEIYMEKNDVLQSFWYEILKFYGDE